MSRDVAELARNTGRDLLLAFLVQAERCAVTGCALCQRDAQDFRAALAQQPPSITCPRCESVESYNLRYCGHCHRFLDNDTVARGTSQTSERSQT